MPDEKPNANQQLSGGEGSTNLQAGGDINIHNVAVSKPSESFIQRVSNAQIARFDPKTQELLKDIGRTLANGRWSFFGIIFLAAWFPLYFSFDDFLRALHSMVMLIHAFIPSWLLK
jgi:hypothetical protein